MFLEVHNFDRVTKRIAIPTELESVENETWFDSWILLISYQYLQLAYGDGIYMCIQSLHTWYDSNLIHYFLYITSDFVIHFDFPCATPLPICNIIYDIQHEKLKRIQ